MALKAAHLFFVTAATLLAGGLGAWVIVAAVIVTGVVATAMTLGALGQVPGAWRCLRRVAIGSAQRTIRLSSSTLRPRTWRSSTSCPS